MGGTVRILTRKPVLDAFAATVRASLSTPQGGGGGHGLKGMFNLPLADDRPGLRGVLNDEQLQGWMDDPATERENLNAQRIHTARVRLRFSPDGATDIDASCWRWRSAARGAWLQRARRHAARRAVRAAIVLGLAQPSPSSAALVAQQ
jgi:Outer membrane receptor for ferrienterochelin and colicins